MNDCTDRRTGSRPASPATDKACIDELENPRIRDLDIGKFDLVMFSLHFSECFLPLVRTSKVIH